MERKKVLVTGASGFIGSNLSELLKKSHYEVVTTDLAGNVDLKADIRHLEKENLNLNEFYSVVHLAAKISVPESFENPELYHEVNVNATEKLFEQCIKAEVPRIVFASSAAVYGEVEDGIMVVGSENPPMSPYAETKILGEKMASELSSQSTRITCLRFFNVYGPGQSYSSPYASAVPIFIEKLYRKKPITIFGDGNQTRDFIHVSDVCKAIFNSFDFEIPVYSTYNLGTGESISINNLIKCLRRIFSDFGHETEEPIYSSPREGDILHSIADMATNAPFYYQTEKTEIGMGLRDLIKRTLSDN